IRKNRYDLVINIQRFFSTGFITAFSRARNTTGFNKNPLSFFYTSRFRHSIGTCEPIHETERNLTLLQPFCKINKPVVKLYPNHEDYKTVKPLINQPFITIASSSLWFTKQFPEGSWIEFIQQLRNDITVYLLGSKSDRERNQRIALACSANHNVIDLSGKLSLLESATLMKHAVMNYTNDSAPMHLASAANGPVTVVFCSTVPAFGFGPLSEKSFVIETTEKLECRPCGLHGKKRCPEKHFKCATTISITQLLSTLK
ncbi:MAG TPA: glycosyltransferase family 9 protein, partial [Bacteroidales bacterium]|nr:glycosyltransferase family 9 protein [Bacteroidales bacterium]